MRKNHILMLAIFFLLVFTLPGLAAEKEPLWQFEAGMPLTGTPTYDKGVVYKEIRGAVYALNAETGERYGSMMLELPLLSRRYE